MEEYRLPHIFDRYSRGESASPGGVRRGLFIARAIVEAHRGAITVGVGTRIAFTLPCASPDE